MKSIIIIHYHKINSTSIELHTFMKDLILVCYSRHASPVEKKEINMTIERNSCSSCDYNFSIHVSINNFAFLLYDTMLSLKYT